MSEQSKRAVSLAEYQQLYKICTTSSSDIYRAVRQKEGKQVLLKLPNREKAAIAHARFHHEFELLQSLDLQDVARPIALIDEPGCLAMVLEDFPGRSLDALLNERRLDVLIGLRIAHRLACALVGVHAAGLVHRDLRPSNVLVNPETACICLADFSLATTGSALAASLPLSGEDFAYISPEQTGRMNRAVDYRTDFYSLGVMLYRLFSGKLPFHASDPLEWVHCHLARLPRSLNRAAAEVPRMVSDIVARLTAKMPEDRYQSAYGLQYDLERCLGQWETSGSIVPFPLGARDMSDRFRIPQKLYGRGAESMQIVAAFDRMIATGTPALLLIKGAAGIGKSSLVHELHKPVVRERGYFISGKFEQYKRGSPYATIADAFSRVIRQILAEPEERIASWRKLLQTQLGANCLLMVEIIPQLELILGPESRQTRIPELPPLETQRRFQRVFQHFVNLFASPEHPLVMFMDDLQWADAASIELLVQVLSQQPEARPMMLVGAYRDNEVTGTHPLTAAIETLSRTIPVQTVCPLPLDDDSLCQMLVDTLHCEPVQSLPLALLIQSKTNGNPLIVSQFLLTLHRDGLIVFDHQAGRWQWSWEQIGALRVADNVADLLADRISGLDAVSQELLRLAACLGHQFELETLAYVAMRAPSNVRQQLEPAVAENFLLLVRGAGGAGHSAARSPDPSVIYCWSHDRLQQVAYSSMLEDQRAKVHLRIGRQLLERTPENQLSARIFEIVNHLNRGQSLITDPRERKRLAGFNLTAAVRAKRSGAYTAALDYAMAGQKQLPPAAWKHDYSLDLALRRESIEAAYLCRRYDEAEALLDQALNEIGVNSDRAGLLRMRVVYATTQRDEARAIRAALDGLRLVGVELPADSDDWAAALQAGLVRIDQVLAGVSIEDLLDLPEMTNPTHIAAVELLASGFGAARSIDPRLNALLAVTLVELSLKFGNAGVSAYGFCMFGAVLVQSRQDFDRGYRFGRLARQLADRFHRPDLTAKVNMVVTSFLSPWREPMEASIAMAMEGFSAEVEHGDLHYAGFNLLIANMRRLARGERLDALTEELDKALVFTRQTANDMASRILQLQKELVDVLRGQPTDNPPETRTIEAILERLQARTDDLARHEQIFALKRFILFGAFRDALRLSQRPGVSTLLTDPIYSSAEMRLYHALAAAACVDMQDGPGRQAALTLLRATEEQFAIWARGCPANFAHMHLLLGAELARLNDQHEDAVSCYDRAIAASAAAGFLHIEGLVAERAAGACLAHGASAQAAAYLEVARNAYAAWGADAKVKQLDSRTLQGTAPTIAASREQLDLLSIVKASQAISREIELEQLLHTLMDVLIQNAGAQRGCLILLDENGLSVAAEAYVEDEHVRVRLPRESDVKEFPLPVSILNYVRRSREQVLLEDVAEANLYSGDPYLERRQPKSVLCMPILRQANLVGMLYLEHRLLSRAFTPDRVAVLQLLASQAAISLENARLYVELRERETRIRRLLESNIIGIFSWDMGGRVSEANEAFLRIVGYSRQDLLDGRIDWKNLTPSEYRAADEAAHAELMLSGACTPYEKEYIRKDGSRIPVLLGGAFTDGSQDSGIALMLDLTERKQAEADRAARKTAEAASEAKSLFLANMSHELRSSLNTVLGFAGLLERRAELSPDVKQDIAIMLRSGEHLRALINQLLDLGKIEAGKAEVEESNFDLDDLLDELQEMFQQRAANKGLALEFQHADMPRIIRTDAVKLRQVLINLLGNALNFTTQGSVILRTGHFIGQSGLRLTFELTDTGVGIGPDEFDNLFRPFTQTRAGQRAGEGTGLGLAISRNFVRLMGGDIVIESQPGQGTTVRFDIPVQVVDAEAIPISPERTKRRAVGLEPGQQRYRVLIVDDTLEARRLLSRLLTPLGFEVQEAENGQEALAIWQTWRPHLICMDIRMPGMDGAEATRRIRDGADGKSTVIFALTAGAGREPVATLTAWFDEIFIKPLSEEALFAAMERHLGARFVYETQVPAGPDQGLIIQSAALADLPDALRSALEQALICLDYEGVTKAIAQVPDASLARALGIMADGFQYGRMLHLLQLVEGGAQT
jgi:PAS domain S-box-containing protein